MNEQQQRGRNNKRRGKAIEREVRGRIIKFFGRFIELPEKPEELDEIVYRHKDNGSPVSDLETYDLGDMEWHVNSPEIKDYLPLEGAVIEVKSRQAPPPEWQRKAFQQAEEAARQTGKRPYVIVSYLEEDGKRHLYVMRRFGWIEKEYE